MSPASVRQLWRRHGVTYKYVVMRARPTCLVEGRKFPTLAVGVRIARAIPAIVDRKIKDKTFDRQCMCNASATSGCDARLRTWTDAVTTVGHALEET